MTVIEGLLLLIINASMLLIYSKDMGERRTSMNQWGAVTGIKNNYTRDKYYIKIQL